VQLKDNQPTLHQASAEVAATTTPLETVQSHDIGRNRDERRTVSVFAPAQALANTDWQPHVAAIIRVEREVFTRGSKSGLLTRSAETAFDISNAPVPPAPPPRSARTGASRQPRITAATSRWAKIVRASAAIPASPPACAASPSTSSKPTETPRSASTATAPPSEDSKTCSIGSLCHSVEQPCQMA